MIPKGVLKNKILSGYRNNPLIESWIWKDTFTSLWYLFTMNCLF
jgi:hypothetical protein